jgi:hypothetical protein
MHATPWPRAIRTPSRILSRYTIIPAPPAETVPCEQDLGCRIVRMDRSLMMHPRYTMLLRHVFDSVPRVDALSPRMYGRI